MVIHSFIRGLSTFAHVRTKVATNGGNVKYGVLFQIRRARYIRPSKQFGIDVAVQRTALPCNILFLNEVVDEDARHVVGVGQNYWYFHASKREEQVDTSLITFTGI